MNRTTQPSPFVLLALLVAGSAFLAPATAGTSSSAATAQDGKVATRYVQISVPEATAKNIADPRGLSVGTFERGTPLLVSREQGGFLAVEAPGGFRAWVLGRFLKKTDVSGVREVQGNGVNIRPGPKDDVRNFPLGTPLFAGDRVRVLEKSDVTLSDEEAWFQILTPPGVTAWIESSSVSDFPAGVDARAAWLRAVESAKPIVTVPAAVPIKPVVVDTRAEVISTPKKEDARSVLEGARRLLAAEQNKNVPDFGRVRTELMRAKAMGGESQVAVEAQGELERVAALEDVAVLRSRLETERQRVVSETADAQAEAWNRARQKDPLGTLFHARGVLERRLEADGTPRFVLVAGGTASKELRCTSGRYDLNMFLGFQVGVRGREQTLLGTQIIDLQALEVVARR